VRHQDPRPRNERRPHRLLRHPPYASLREEFEQRLRALHTTGELPDPRDAQIARLKNEIDTLKQRIARRDQTIAELTDVKAEALSRLAAQHEEITHLRQQTDGTSGVRRLPTRTTAIGPCS
jgi:chromosome segregation ATPase